MITIRSFRDLLRLFFIFRREVQITVLATFAIIVLGAFLLPNRYESTALLLVKPGRDTSTVPIELADRQTVVAPSGLRDPLLDEERMLTGRPIIRAVAQQYIAKVSDAQENAGMLATLKRLPGTMVRGLVGAARSVFEFLGLIEARTPEERLAEDLEKHFKVSHDPGSSVMELTFTWDDPEVAQAILKSWVDQYGIERARILGRVNLYAFYEQEVKDTQANILQHKREIQTLLDQIGTVSINQRLADVAQGLNDLRTERNNTMRAIASTKAGIDKIQEQINRQTRLISSGKEMALNPSRQDLQTRINGKEEERQELLRSFKENAPPVKALDSEIANLRALWAKESHTVQRTENIAPNPLFTRLQNILNDQQASYTRLLVQKQQLDAQLEQWEKDRQQALALEPRLSRLQNELNAEEKNFVLYTDSLEKARIDRELDNKQISNISVVEHATLNPSRVFPKSLLMLLLAIPLSLGVGLLALYLFYLLDQRIHDGDKIEAQFKVPLWTTLPDLNTVTPQQRSGFIASLYRLYSVLPLKQVPEKGLSIGLTSAHAGEGVSFVIEHLRRLLEEHGHQVRLGDGRPAEAGEIQLIDASNFFARQEVFIHLREADLIVLVIGAETSTVPRLQNTLSTLSTAFKHVDGIILNRRRFEIPEQVLAWLGRLRSHH
ncbi:lipopolysaccharide biosynthesis protein [Pseudomonas sp. GD03842]|uniref:GumC family protein n=1 Tax=Pseudomonas sp. GD03842 TaxID=2975385 RepID=UPI002448B5D8|nr:lipopolysaccharide biosynthesis protein [Pseudomonas sp. GD03842]MDH0748684.1 lipopolysaccharide biosynthesis protein [Pseudomonas sp. GD03842]